jgi:hypothetical protein
MEELTRWEYIRAVIAKWIVVNIAARISPFAVLHLILETSELYHQKLTEEMESVEPNE